MGGRQLAAPARGAEAAGRAAARPGRRPAKLHADKGYDIPRCHAALAARGIGDRIARIGVESSRRLGRHRWVVERTRAWCSQFRRLRVRDERRADIREALLSLGAALICWRFLGAAPTGPRVASPRAP